ELNHSAKAALDEYLATHFLFEQAVQKLADERVAALRDSIRAEVLRQESHVQESIETLKQKFDDAERQRQQILGELTQMENEKAQLEASVAELRHKPRVSFNWMASVGKSVKVLESPNQVVGHLEKNLSRMGLLAQSAQKMAREAFAATCLGQMVMLRG